MKLSENSFCSDPAETARVITERYGIDIIADHQRFCSAFGDFAPKLSRERKAFYIALSENIGSFFLSQNELVKSGELLPDDVVNQALSEISEYLNHEKAEMVAKSLAAALGWELSGGIRTDDTDSETLPLTGSVIEDLYRKANGGDNDACFNLAERYFYGNGVRPDQKKAVDWYTRSAERGDCSSQKRLAECYRYGQGTDRDFSKVAYWLTKAAEQGDYDSQKALIMCYKLGGEKLPPDEAKAALFSERYGLSVNTGELDSIAAAAENGNPEAQFRLGNMYFSGTGVDEDCMSAVHWYKLAAAQQYPAAQYNLAYCYASGIGVEQDDEKAAQLYDAAAQSGDADAINNLASMYFQGLGVPRDRKKAASLWMRAADKGLAHAAYNCGECYYNGWGVEQDKEIALRWFRNAASASDPDAQYSCGWCMYSGEGCAVNYTAAKRMLELSAAQKNPNAMKLLGYMYMNGNGIEKNFGKAAEMFAGAAACGDNEAAKMLVICHKYGGQYLVSNEQKARRLAQKYSVNYNAV